jgi:hypothetical protein
MDFLVTNAISHRDTRKQGVKFLVKTVFIAASALGIWVCFNL